MELIDLSEVIQELSLFYERKEPKTATVELWHRLVKRIPKEPLKWITKKIEENYEYFPKNITAALWSAYTEWQQANPEKAVKKTYFECQDCNEGLIFARKKTKDNNYSYVFRCAKCRQDTTRGYPVASRQELREEGYAIVPKEGNLNISTNKNISELTAGIGETIH